MGGTCWVASARNASAIRCGCEVIIDFQAGVSITSVAWLRGRGGGQHGGRRRTVYGETQHRQGHRVQKLEPLIRYGGKLAGNNKMSV